MPLCLISTQRKVDFLSMNRKRFYMIRNGVNSNDEFETSEGSFQKSALSSQVWHSNVLSNRTDWLFNRFADAYKWRLFHMFWNYRNQVTIMLYQICKCSIRIKTYRLNKSGNYTAHVTPALTNRQSTPCAWFLCLVWSQQTASIAQTALTLWYL